MKKCKDCKREIDKYAIACQYCGRLLEGHDHKGMMNDAGPDLSVEQSRDKKNK